MNNENFFVLFIETMQNRWDDIFVALQEHLFLSFISIMIAILLSVPLGVFISRRKKLAEPFIAVAAIFQTVPSLALFGFLIPFLGIGNITAIIALTVYALLPILRNTYTGITSVDQSSIEAGRGMGMTNMQILMKIEVPLSLPVIMAGVRTATVLTIGVATLATFVGAGGLGDIIYRGLTSNKDELVLAGALPATILALLFDLILKLLENAATPKGVKAKK
jgi:osmoprotectant transport system permease protein